jgi:porin
MRKRGLTPVALATFLTIGLADASFADEPPAEPPQEKPILLINNMGQAVEVPASDIPSSLLPPPKVGLADQVPNLPSRGAKLPPEALRRIETSPSRISGFELFPAAQPRLASYLAGQDELGNTAMRPGPLLDVFPLEPEVQAAKYDLSRFGLRYSLRQTVNYSGLDQATSGSTNLGFYTVDLITKWAVFASPSTAGWLSAQIEAKTGIGPAGQTQSTQTNLGTLTSPTPQWSSHNGFRIPELDWQQSFRGGKFVVLAGVVAQGNYIDGNLYASSSRGQFMNSALVNTMVVPLPSYNFGVNLQCQPSGDWYAIIGASAGNAGAGETPWTNFNWDNWSVLGEIGYMPDDFLGLGPGVYRIQPFVARAGGPTQGGVGFNFRQQLGQHSPFGWFGRFGVGGSQVSGGASTQIGTGFVMNGPLAHLGLVPRLTNDFVGIGFVWSQPSATTKTVYHENEYVLESFYTLQLAPAVRIQPDLQIVWNPAFNADAGPFVVFQAQWIVAW